MTLYILIINALFFFAIGYLAKVAMVISSNKSAEQKLQERAQKGEYLPIIMNFDLNHLGGYTASMYNMRGVHLRKENHDTFLQVLMDILDNEKKRPLVPIKPDFKLLNFKKDSQ